MERLTKKEKGFADDFIETGIGVTSALKNYDTDNYNTAGVIANENLKKHKIQEYIASKAENASQRIFELSKQNENLPVALNASKDILDRAGFKAVEKTLNVNFDVDVKDPHAMELAKEYEEKLRQAIKQ